VFEIETNSSVTCCGVLIEGSFRYEGGEATRFLVWPMNGEGFTEGEKGDGGGARVPKRGEATATGGAPDLLEYVGVSGLFLFTATM
jgi:hypothetical protein